MKKKKKSFFAKVRYVIFGDKKERNTPPSDPADDLLGEFSGENDEFYTDEIANRNKKKRSKNKKKVSEIITLQNKKRKPLTPAKRRIRNIMSFSVVLVVVLAAVIVLSLTVLFKTQIIEVNGTTRYSANEIIATSGLTEGENIFLAPKGIASKRIEDKYPYVEKADIDIRIPDTLIINITETKEAYAIKASDTQYLTVGSNGKILSISSFPPEKLPLFIGPVVTSAEEGKPVVYGDDTIPEIISVIAKSFTDNGYTGITEINASELSSLTFTYDNRIVVKLGLPEHLDYKIRTAMTIITEKLDLQTVNPIKGKLDVSKCYDTKKSYFREEGLGEDTIQQDTSATQDPSEVSSETTAKPTEPAGELTWEDLFREETVSASEEETEPTEAPTVKKLPQEQWYVN